MKIHAEMREILSEVVLQYEIPSQEFNIIHSLLVQQYNDVALSVIEIQNKLCYFLKSPFCSTPVRTIVPGTITSGYS